VICVFEQLKLLENLLCRGFDRDFCRFLILSRAMPKDVEAANGRISETAADRSRDDDPSPIVRNSEETFSYGRPRTSYSRKRVGTPPKGFVLSRGRREVVDERRPSTATMKERLWTQSADDRMY
jgi:hypothetical protein